MQPERIAAAAVQIGDLTISKPPPHRHHHVMHEVASAFGWRVSPRDTGFVTSAGRYVDRIEAKRIARDAGQLLERAMGGDELFSEDVW